MTFRDKLCTKFGTNADASNLPKSMYEWVKNNNDIYANSNLEQILWTTRLVVYNKLKILETYLVKLIISIKPYELLLLFIALF
jgi:hypothetical protein